MPVSGRVKRERSREVKVCLWMPNDIKFMLCHLQDKIISAQEQAMRIAVKLSPTACVFSADLSLLESRKADTAIEQGQVAAVSDILVANFKLCRLQSAYVDTVDRWVDLAVITQALPGCWPGTPAETADLLIGVTLKSQECRIAPKGLRAERRRGLRHMLHEISSVVREAVCHTVCRTGLSQHASYLVHMRQSLRCLFPRGFRAGHTDVSFVC